MYNKINKIHVLIPCKIRDCNSYQEGRLENNLQVGGGHWHGWLDTLEDILEAWFKGPLLSS